MKNVAVHKHCLTLISNIFIDVTVSLPFFSFSRDVSTAISNLFQASQKEKGLTVKQVNILLFRTIQSGEHLHSYCLTLTKD